MKDVTNIDGWARTEDNVLYKLNQLESYAKKGWLKYGQRGIRPEHRLEAGLTFQRDFYHSRIDTMTAINWAKEKVDTSINAELPPFVWDARKRFVEALRAIKAQHLRAVQVVVLEDKPLKVKFTGADDDYKFFNAEARRMLCGGLDDLAIFYGVRPIKSKVVGFCNKYFWEA